MLLLSLPLGWLGWKMQEARRQRRAVETIERLGEIVRYDYQDEGRMFIPSIDGPPPGPDWLRNLVGVDFLAKAYKVVFVAPMPAGDTVFRALEDLPHFDELYFEDPSATDDSTVEKLTGLKQLSFLLLWKSEITDASLRRLAGMKNLTRLDIEGTKVTKAGVVELQRASPNLQIDGP